MRIVVFFIDFNEVIYGVPTEMSGTMEALTDNGFVLYSLEQIREKPNLFLGVCHVKKIQFTKIYQTIIE